MTTAFNLSQIANYLNTSGQLNLATGVTGTLPQANGGTGATSLASVAVTSLTAGPGISLNASVGTVTVTNTGGAGGATATSSATDVTLTSASNRVQAISMTTFGKRVILPDATTITTLGGPLFIITNNGLYPFNLCTTDGFSLATVGSNGGVTVALSSSASANSNWIVNESPATVSMSAISPSAIVPTLTSAIDVQALSSTSVLICYCTGTGTVSFNAVVATISGSTVTYGTPWTAGNTLTTTQAGISCAVLTSTAAIFGYTDQNSNTRFYGLVISGTTITASPVSTSTQPLASLRKLNSTQAIFIGATDGSYGTETCRIIAHNGTSALTLGSSASLGTITGALTGDVVALTTSSFAAFFENYGRVGTVSGTTITLGALSAQNIPGGGAPYAYSATECGILASSGTRTTVCTVSGTAITFSVSSTIGTTVSMNNRALAQLDTTNALTTTFNGSNVIRLKYIPTVGFRYAGIAGNGSTATFVTPLTTTTGFWEGLNVASGVNPVLVSSATNIGSGVAKILD
jgi:hypothetical protein